MPDPTGAAWGCSVEGLSGESLALSGKQRMSGAGRSGSRRARRVIARPPKFLGWNTTDQEEVERRRWRGRSELMELEAQDPDQGFFGTFRVRSASGSGYDVEVRSLASPDNSCGCIDHRVNGLGTCKHIEGVLFALRRGRARDFDRAARRGAAHARRSTSAATARRVRASSGRRRSRQSRCAAPCRRSSRTRAT